LVQRSERKLAFGLVAQGENNPTVRGMCTGELQQRSLANAGLASQYQGAAPSSADVLDEPAQLVAFGAPA
jgi:hypothetical protein